MEDMNMNVETMETTVDTMENTEVNGVENTSSDNGIVKKIAAGAGAVVGGIVVLKAIKWVYCKATGKENKPEKVTIRFRSPIVINRVTVETPEADTNQSSEESK